MNELISYNNVCEPVPGFAHMLKFPHTGDHSTSPKSANIYTYNYTYTPKRYQCILPLYHLALCNYNIAFNTYNLACISILILIIISRAFQN